MKKITGLFFICFVLLFCTSTFAEEFNRFGLGIKVAYQDFEPGTFGDVNFEFDRTPLGGINLTYHLHKSYSLELSTDYNKSDMVLEYDTKDGVFGDLAQQSVSITGRFRFLINRTNSYIHLGVGGGYFYNEFTTHEQEEVSDFFALNQSAVSENSIGFHFLTGIEIFITPHYAVNLEVKSIFNKANFDITYLDLTTETKEVALNASIYTIGFKYYF